MSDQDESEFAVDDLPAAEWAAIEEAVFAELEGEAAAPASAKRPSNALMLASVAVLSAAVAMLSMVGFGAFEREAPRPATTHSTRFHGGPEGAEVALDDIRLVLGANSEGLAVGGSDVGWVVALDEGRVEFVVASRAERPPFVVQAADTRVEVVGTRFSVVRHASHVEVAVDDGIVRVTHDGQVQELRAGERWATALEPSSTPTNETRETTVTSEANDGSEPAPPTMHRPSDTAAYERAAALEAEDPAAAIRLYRRLARGGGPWAEAALFARARLEMETGNIQGGSRALQRYLRRYPNGINAQDARFLLRLSDSSGMR